MVAHVLGVSPRDTLPARFGAHCQLLPTGALAAHDTGEPGTTRTLWETRNSTTDLSDIRGTACAQSNTPKSRAEIKGKDTNKQPGHNLLNLSEDADSEGIDEPGVNTGQWLTGEFLYFQPEQVIWKPNLSAAVRSPAQLLFRDCPG